MPVEVKMFFSTVSLLAGVAALFLTPRHRNSGRWWRAGERDPIRAIFYNREGEFRRYAKHGIVVWLVLVNVLIWLLL